MSIRTVNLPPVRPPNRAVIYDVIDGERDYQDEQWSATDRDLTPGEFIILFEEYVAKARAAWVKKHGDRAAVDSFRKLAAIAVRAMEMHGALPREFHVPASAGITGVMEAHDLGDILVPPSQDF
jgi:hypothetical protein